MLVDWEGMEVVFSGWITRILISSKRIRWVEKCEIYWW